VSAGTGQFNGATGTGNFTSSVAAIAGSSTQGTFTINGSLTLVQPAPSVKPSDVAPSSLSFKFAADAPGVSSQAITVKSGRSQPNTFTATTTTQNGGTWLSVAPGNGSLAAYGSSSITASVNSTTLAVGTFQGAVVVKFATGESFTVPLTVVVSPAAPLTVSPTGLQFTGVAGLDFAQIDAVTLVNGRAAPAAVSVSATTATPGQTWLSVSPASVSLPASSATSITITVNAKNLAPGTYYAKLDITVPPPDAPLAVTVVFNVLAPTAPIPPILGTNALVYFAAAGLNRSPRVINPSSAAINVTPHATFLVGAPWLTITPASASIPSLGSVRFTITADPVVLQDADRSQTIYRALVLYQPDTGPGVTLEAVYLPTPPSSSTVPSGSTLRAAGCTPTLIAPQFANLGAAFVTTAGWPVSLLVLVTDNCGNSVDLGSVTASFTTGDLPISLTPVGGGVWSGTWQPRDAKGANVGITVTAKNPQGLTGTDRIEGNVSANPVTPVINAGGVVSAVDYAAGAPVAPGGYVAIFGTKLATSIGVSNVFPLATQLNTTQVIIGGRVVPLKFVSDGQINAILPYDLPANSVQQVIVQQGAQYSTAEPIAVGRAAPAILSANQSGSGQGVVVVVKADTSQFLNDASHPASAGDALVIYCTSLGGVTPTVIEGTAAPGSPAATTTEKVTVSIGGAPAQTFFAGLTPGFAGLYQVNAFVPSGLAPGAAVPLVISVAGQVSNTVTVAIQ
jgi:uncharacterized protein (TIGR03437 family)